MLDVRPEPRPSELPGPLRRGGDNGPAWTQGLQRVHRETPTNVLQNYVYLQRPARSSGEASSLRQAHL